MLSINTKNMEMLGLEKNKIQFFNLIVKILSKKCNFENARNENGRHSDNRIL